MIQHPSSVLDTVLPLKDETNIFHIKNPFVRIFYQFERYCIFSSTETIQEKVRTLASFIHKVSLRFKDSFSLLKKAMKIKQEKPWS